MIRPNIETFIGCESSFEDKHLWFFMVHPSIPQQAFAQVPDLVRQPYAMRASDWRPTVHIRIKTLWISGCLTAEIWSFVLEAVEMALSDIEKQNEGNIESRQSSHCCLEENILVTLGSGTCCSCINIRIFISFILMHMQI